MRHVMAGKAFLFCYKGRDVEPTNHSGHMEPVLLSTNQIFYVYQVSFYISRTEYPKYKSI